jgi:hypothetical protein
MIVSRKVVVTCAAWVISFALLGCGGRVNLGGNTDESPGPDSGGRASDAPDSEDSSESERVAELAEDFGASTLAIAGEFLYFSGRPGLYRCRKADCGSTREHLPDASGEIWVLQINEQRLGVTSVDDGSFSLGSYALPDATDRQIAIQQLPTFWPFNPLFFGDFVYFSLNGEEGVYRCELPDCAAGPERIGRVLSGNTTIRADGQLVFWRDSQFIYRADDYGHEMPRALLPDAMLSEAPDSAASADGSEPVIAAIAAGGGMLYASIWQFESGQPCDSSACPSVVARWPVDGGAREVLFTSERPVLALFLFDGELAWLSLSALGYDPATLSSCRVEACEMTRRDLGQVKADLAALVADERDLYWLEAKPAETLTAFRNSSFADRQIRRAPRLPPPSSR